jgi:hypothetical protein
MDELPIWAYERVSDMAHLRYFPATENAARNLARLLVEICREAKAATPQQQAAWLTAEVCRTCDEYPGPKTIRELYASKYPPPTSPRATWVQQEAPRLSEADEARAAAEVAELEAELLRKFAASPRASVAPRGPLPEIVNPITADDLLKALNQRGVDHARRPARQCPRCGLTDCACIMDGNNGE